MWLSTTIQELRVSASVPANATSLHPHRVRSMTSCRLENQRCLLVALIAAALLLPLAATTQRAEARASSEAAAETKKKPTPAGPILAIVSLAKQRISVYGHAGLLAQSPVSTGMPGYRTPAGVFSVLQKSKFHRSNIYWNAPMPYMQRITWSGVTLHAGVVPGYPASHGCIRLPHRFAVDLYGMTKVGARIIIAPDDASVLSVEASRLPAPKLTPAPAEESGHSQAASTEVKTPGAPAASTVKVAASSANAASPPPRLLDPMERARLIKLNAVADAAAKVKAAKAAVEASALKAAAARTGAATLRASETALASVQARREAAAKALDRTSTAEMATRAKLALANAETKHAEAEQANADARALETAAAAAAMAAARLASDAEQASREAATALKAAERGTEPISIFISKKTGRVYIRQSWAPIYEAPVTIRDSEQPIGTHLYLAVAPDANRQALSWLSVSLRACAAPRNKLGQERAGRTRTARHEHAPETAAGALARFELPEEAKRFIEERLWTGASLIISDEGVSNETGTYTDFIVLTR